MIKKRALYFLLFSLYSHRFNWLFLKTCLTDIRFLLMYWVTNVILLLSLSLRGALYFVFIKLLCNANTEEIKHFISWRICVTSVSNIFLRVGLLCCHELSNRWASLACNSKVVPGSSLCWTILGFWSLAYMYVCEREREKKWFWYFSSKRWPQKGSK